MGVSISACLLDAGCSLQCVEKDPVRRSTVKRKLRKQLEEAHADGASHATPTDLLKRIVVSGEMESLRESEIVIEATVEDLALKRRVIGQIESAVSARALIASNTSALPITELQKHAAHPERILGMHWAEPAHLTRFMEVICGDQTALSSAHHAMALARSWGKEPSLVRKDIRGFISNRIMYAMLREAFHLVESGFASIEDVDRSLRNDLGYWITFAGPFRFMDLTGIPSYAAVMKDLLPDLDRSTGVPALMRRTVASGARGVSNAKGFYRYTTGQAKRWERLFYEFSVQIRELASRFPEDAGDRRGLSPRTKKLRAPIARS